MLAILGLAGCSGDDEGSSEGNGAPAVGDDALGAGQDPGSMGTTDNGLASDATGGQDDSSAGVAGGAMASPGQGTGSAMDDPSTAGSGGAMVEPDAGFSGGAGAMMGDAGAVMTDACDRACLLSIMQGYIDALIANDPSTLPVAASHRYTENGVESTLGETVWQTATELVADARLDFADPQEGQVASQFVFNEGSAPVIYQVRLKVVAHEITEIETMAVRRRGAANGFFNPERMKPEPVFLQEIEPAARMPRDELIRITDLYLDYLEGSTRADGVPFDEECKRYENGQVTASGLSSFNAQRWSFDVTRRILVVDEEAGITWGMFPFTQSANSLVVGEAFKIIDGEIMMIQAVMANQPAKTWD